jgi:hypothetical protein
MKLFGERIGATRNGHNRHAAIALSFVIKRNGNSFMSDVDWRSEEAYANFKNAESMDIAWEWLRRDSLYQEDFRNLEDAQRLSGATETFRQQWGLSFRG